MKAPYCAICHKRAFPGGGEVHFVDYVPLPPDTCGDPPGHRYFCAEHLAAASRLSLLTASAAIKLLGLRFGEFPPFEVVNKAELVKVEAFLKEPCVGRGGKRNASTIGAHSTCSMRRSTDGMLDTASDGNDDQLDLFE